MTVQSAMRLFSGLILIIGFAAPTVAQTTWHVDDDAPDDPGPGDPTVSDPNENGSMDRPFDAIQEAIDACVTGDSVSIANGTYTGVGNKDLDFAGLSIAVASASGPADCIVDCENDGRGFLFDDGESPEALLDGLTILNGNASQGGGILCRANSRPLIRNCVVSECVGDDGGGGVALFSSATFINCDILGNQDNDGGGVFCAAGEPTLRDCLVSGNVSLRGGGIQCTGDNTMATIIDCDFVSNNADRGGGAYLHLDGTASFRNCTFEENTAIAGGGLYLEWASAAITECLFARNHTTGSGGGINWLRPHRDSALSYSSFHENSAGGAGGGVYVQLSGVAPAMDNCIFTHNTATGNGGGYFSRAGIDVANCVFVGNSASSIGGGLATNDGVVYVLNSILWGNSAPEGPQLANLSPLSTNPPSTISYCDIQGGESDVYINEPEMVRWAEGNIDIYPAFDDPDGPDNDPNTWEDNSYKLLSGSPCIDAGCNWNAARDSADLDGDGDTKEYGFVDFDGEGRFFDDPNTTDAGCGFAPVVDIGAYEYGGTGPRPHFADFDGDLDIDVGDLAALLSNYGEANGVCLGDLDCDGDVELSDLSALLAAYGTAYVNIETLSVGNAENIGEGSGVDYGGWGPSRICGSVDYPYMIGSREITAGQYCVFLNAVAKSDPHGLYNTYMDVSPFGCQITRSGSDGVYKYDFSGRPSGTERDWENRPVNFVSWGDAARFANWLHNGQPAGAQDLETTEDGAYFLNGAMSETELLAVTRVPEARWVIPSEDEWYKAAYHRNDGATGNYWDYPIGGDAVPDNGNPGGDSGNSAAFNDGDEAIGDPYWRAEVAFFAFSNGPYGTFDQGGNVWEWNEANVIGMFRGVRGGSFSEDELPMNAAYRFLRVPTDEEPDIGFRVTEIPLTRD